jgi:NADH-quinone oxidoreductase subunit E
MRRKAPGGAQQPPTPVVEPALAGRTMDGTPTTGFYGEAGRPTPHERFEIPQYLPASWSDEETVRDRAREIIARYPHPRSALMPLLHLCQSIDGFVSSDGVTFCAHTLGLSEAEVNGVATFYTMFKRKPCGQHLISVCTNTMCAVLGGERIYDTLCEHLGVAHEETSGDPGAPGSVTLEHVECLASCDLGPVVTVDYELFDQQTPQTALELVSALQRGERPVPTRGAPLTDFKDAELQLAGFLQNRDADVDGPSATPETLRGAGLAAERGWRAPAMPARPPAFPALPVKK